MVFESPRKASEFAILKWREIAGKAIKARRKFTVALSGGRTPTLFYNMLADEKGYQHWKATHVFLVDERFVPHHEYGSNFGMIRRSLLSKIAMPKNNAHPVPIKKTPHASAMQYGEGIKAFFGLKTEGFPRFDLVMLGIGEDGHTASLFPGDGALFETGRLTAAVQLHTVPYNRITLTLPVINNARNIIFLISGRNKALAMKSILKRKMHSVPASLVMPRSGRVSYVLDSEAGSFLKRPKCVKKLKGRL
jgi:6-phosphogluconolactonase